MISRSNPPFALLGILITLLIASSSGSDRARFYARPLLPDHPVDSLAFMDGDVLLRRGNSVVSGLIVQAFPGGKGMSHCGILLLHEGRWQVIHSISGAISDAEGIRLEAWEEYSGRARRGELRHVRPRFSMDMAVVRSKSLHYLAQNTPFDHEFDLSQDDKLYCSELIRSVYLAAGAEDAFIYRVVGTRRLIDMASFFLPDFWHEL